MPDFLLNLLFKLMLFYGTRKQNISMSTTGTVEGGRSRDKHTKPPTAKVLKLYSVIVVTAGQWLIGKCMWHDVLCIFFYPSPSSMVVERGKIIYTTDDWISVSKSPARSRSNTTT